MKAPLTAEFDACSCRFDVGARVVPCGRYSYDEIDINNGALAMFLDRAQTIRLRDTGIYAELLNMHDGGHRIIFGDARAWLDRLAIGDDFMPGRAHCGPPYTVSTRRAGAGK